MLVNEVFHDLEKPMPELFAELRRVITATPSMREIVVAPGLRKQLLILENHGLCRQLRPDFAYRLTEPLVQYLKRTSPRPAS
jgi:hypothetical protein